MLDLRAPRGVPGGRPPGPAPRSRPRYRPGQAGSRSARPKASVLLASRVADREFGLVGRLLESIGVPVARLDAETAAVEGITVDLDQRAIRIDGRWICPTVTWIRHFAPQAMPARRGAAQRAFSTDSWQALGDQFGAICAETIASSGAGLLQQLAAARAAGIRVPRTIVSTEPIAAAKSLGAGTVIVKALHEHFVEASPGLLTGVFPEVTDVGAMRRADRPARIPVVVQEHIGHEAEIRGYYVRGDVLTFSVSKASPAQPWLEPHAVRARQVEPPPGVAAAMTALATALSVRYGAFDFLITGDEPVFLELNWAGDWRWFETRARARSVTNAVTAMLRDLHRQAVANSFSDRLQDQGHPGGIDLVTFLAKSGRADPIDKR
ncbi:MAG TPA: hypothetical protein VGM14_14605 [Streptosporangiaceae bacterium]